MDRRWMRASTPPKLRKLASRALLALAPLALLGATAEPAWASFTDGLAVVYNPAPVPYVAVDGIPQAPQSLAIGDLNGDGKPDLAVAGEGNTVSVLLGDGSGGFNPASGSPVAIGTDPNAGVNSVAIGDLDGDGKLDIAATLGGANELALLEGDGGGGFQVTTIPVGSGPDAVTIADWTGDGKPDLAVANAGAGTVSILAGDGAGGFSQVPGSPLAVGPTPDSVVLADVNGDGRNDLVVGNYGTDSNPGGVTVVVHGGSTTSYKTGICGQGYCGTEVDAVAVGDLNGDGKPDIAAAEGVEGGVAVLRGDGSGGFDWHGTFRVWGGKYGLWELASTPTSVAIGDLDGDGLKDLVVTDQANQQVSILRNNGDGGFTQVAGKHGAGIYDAGEGNVVNLGGTGYGTGYFPQAIAIGDLNGDGKPDLLSADVAGDVTVLLQGPAAPDAPEVTAATAGARAATVTVSRPSWDGGAPITGYTVTSSPGGKQCAIPGDEFTYLSGSCNVTGLTGEVAYTFTATATNGVGTGAASDPSDSVTPFNAVPGPPSSVVAVAGHGQATISWSAPLDDGGSSISGYTVTSYPGGATCSPASLADLSCTVSGLTVGTSYTFGVIATNSVGNSSQTQSNAVTPFGLPGAPTGVSAAGGPGRAEVEWSAPASDGGSPITGYTVTSAPGGKTCSPVTTRLKCAVEGLTDGTEYTFTVVATNAAGAGPASDPSNVAIPAVPPFPPTGATAVAGFEQATVSWTAPTDTGGPPIAGYTVTSAPDGKTCSTEGELSCTVTGLTPGTSYTFTVTARNVTYAGSPSASSNAVTPLAPWPQFTSADSASFTVGEAGSFTVAASGAPPLSLSVSGELPDGVSFTDNGDGTATLAGTPGHGSAGQYPLTITASNGVSPDATQAFSLTVEPGTDDGGRLTQTGTSSASVPVGTPYSGQLEVTGAIGEVSFTATDGDTAAVSVSPSGAISASAALGAGVYSVSGTDSDSAGGSGTWSFALTVWDPSAGGDPGGSPGPGTGGGSDSGSGSGAGSATSSTATVGAGSGSATVITVGSGENAVVVTVPPGAFGVDASVTVSEIDRSALGGHGVSFAAGRQAVQVTVRATSGGRKITRFRRPLDLAFPAAPPGVVPAHSADGRTWVRIPGLRKPPKLPAGWSDGWYRDGEGAVHILTRHATYFALLAPGSAVTPALRLSLRIHRRLDLRHGHTLVLRARPSFPATLRAVLKRGGRKVASWRAALKPAWKTVRLALPKAARRAGGATLALTLSGAGERISRRVPLAIVSRPAHRAPTRE